MLIEAQNIADGYYDGKGATSPPNYQDYNDNAKFYSNLRVIFVQQLVKRFKADGWKQNPDAVAILAKIDADLKITDNNDPDSTDPNVHPDYNINEQWVPLGLRVGYAAVLPVAKTITETVGRMKYLTPIYKALLSIDGGKALAEQWYQDAIDFYSPYAVGQLKRLIDGETLRLVGTP